MSESILSKLRYSTSVEDTQNCICAWCYFENNQTCTQATTTLGQIVKQVKHNVIEYSTNNMPLCFDCKEYLDLQHRYLHGVEITWLYTLYDEIHMSLLMNSKVKLLDKFSRN